MTPENNWISCTIIILLFASGCTFTSNSNETEIAAETESEQEFELESATESEGETESERESESESITESERETDSESESEAESTDETDSETETETDEGVCTDPYLCSAFTPSDPIIGEDKSYGSVTTYGSPADPENSVGGACNYGQTEIKYYAAIHVHVSASKSDYLGPWQNGHACGGCVRIRTRTADGWMETIARITDRCADEYCGVDLGGAPAADVMPLGPGRYEGEWEWVSCEDHPEVFDGPTSIYVKDGSNDFWSVIQVRNPLSRVSRVLWRKAGSRDFTPFEWAIEAENFYKVPPEMLQDDATFEIRIEYEFSQFQTVLVTGSDLAVADASINI